MNKRRIRVWLYRKALRSCTALCCQDVVDLVSIPHIESINSISGWLDVWHEMVTGSTLNTGRVLAFWHALHHSGLCKREKLATERAVIVQYWNRLPSNVDLLKYSCMSPLFNPWLVVYLIYFPLTFV